MTDATDPRTDDGTSDELNVYTANLSPEDRATFALATGDADLQLDIRLLRMVIAKLVQDSKLDARAIGPMVNVLCRAIALQSKGRRDESELERFLLDAANDALDVLEGAATDADEEIAG